MEVECSRHPGASTIGTQLLDETAPMAGKSWQPSHALPCRRAPVALTTHTVETREGEGDSEWMQNGTTTNTRDPRALKTEDHWLHRLSNTSSKRPLAQLHEWKQQNARERRSLTNALAQVPHKTLLCMKGCWYGWMHWCVCIIILHTLFVVHKHPLLLSPYYTLLSRN